MEITPCSEDKLEIQFVFVENRNKIAVKAKFNLIDHVFQNLTSLYFMRSVKVSTQYLVSQLVGSEASDEKLIGSVIPLSSLESLCESSLEFKNVLGFLQVCKVDTPLTLHTDGQVLDSTSHVELPASSIWALLILAEALGVREAFKKCKGNLERMFRASSAAGKMLSPNVLGFILQSDHSLVHSNLAAYFKQFGSTKEEAALVNSVQAVKPTSHESNDYVPSEGQLYKYEDVGIRANRRAAPQMHYEHNHHNNHHSAPSKESALQSYEDAVPYRPTGTARRHVPVHLPQHPHQHHSQAQPLMPAAGSSHPYSYTPSATTSVPPPPPPVAPTTQSRVRTNPHEAHHTYDLNSIPMPPLPLSQDIHRTPANRRVPFGPAQSGHSGSSLFSPQTDRDYDTDSTGSASDDQLSSEYNMDYITPQKVHRYSHDRHHHEAPAHTYEHESSMHRPATDAYHPPGSHSAASAHRASSNTSLLSTSTSAAARAVSPAAFGSAAPRFPVPPSYATPSNASGARARPTHHTFRTGLDTGTGSTSSQSNGSDGSPQTDFEYEYDSDHGQSSRLVRTVSAAGRGGRRAASALSQSNNSFVAPSSSAKPALSPEDLRISRDIAKLRLQEAKVKEELEASRLRAEREMRDSRLRALELKAAVARTSHSPYRLRAVKVEENTRHNAAIGREYTSGTTPMRVRPSGGTYTNVNSGHKAAPLRRSVEQGPIPQQRLISEEGPQRAAQRVRDAKKIQDRKKAQELAAEKLKQDQKWVLRDRKIQLFKEKQKGGLGFTDYYPNGEEISTTASASTDGVSAQWLRGTVSDPNRRPAPAPSGYKSEQHSENKLRFRYSEPFEPEDQQRDENEWLDRNDIVASGHYSAEALAAVGLGKSPSCKVAVGHSDRAERCVPAAQAAQPPPSPVTIATAPDLISVRVVRAWDLPECLGGTCAYVLVDWGAQGKSVTHTVKHSTEPHYGAMLQFKSPYRAIDPTERDLYLKHAHHEMHLLRAASGAEYASPAGPMQVQIYNRNDSVSDELIASGELDLHHLIVTTNAGEPSVLYLNDSFGQSAGCVELIVKHSLV